MRTPNLHKKSNACSFYLMLQLSHFPVSQVLRFLGKKQSNRNLLLDDCPFLYFPEIPPPGVKPTTLGSRTIDGPLLLFQKLTLKLVKKHFFHTVKKNCVLLSRLSFNMTQHISLAFGHDGSFEKISTVLALVRHFKVSRLQKKMVGVICQMKEKMEKRPVGLIVLLTKLFFFAWTHRT